VHIRTGNAAYADHLRERMSLPVQHDPTVSDHQYALYDETGFRVGRPHGITDKSVRAIRAELAKAPAPAKVAEKPTGFAVGPDGQMQFA
jgi:hypothetical protein